MANAVAELRDAGSVRAARAVHGFRRDVEARHDARVLADEIEFGDVFEKPQAGGKHQAAAVGAQQLVGALGAFRLRLLLRDERAVAVGDFHLHVGNPRARRGTRGVLDGELGDARQLPQAVHAAAVGNEGILGVHVQASRKRRGALLEKHPAVAHVAARARPRDSAGGIAVERELDLGRGGGAKEAGKERRIAPLGDHEVGVGGAKQPLEASSHRLFGAVEHARNTLHFHFERPVPSVLRINTPRPCLCQPIFQPHAHRPEGWQLVIHRPLVVAAFDGAYFGTRD